MEQALSEVTHHRVTWQMVDTLSCGVQVCKDIRIGKILIQTNWDTGEPELYYLRLPKDIKDYQVILMDATVATGAAAMMAIRVLLDHDVPEHNINLVSLLMAESGEIFVNLRLQLYVYMSDKCCRCPHHRLRISPREDRDHGRGPRDQREVPRAARHRQLRRQILRHGAQECGQQIRVPRRLRHVAIFYHFL